VFNSKPTLSYNLAHDCATVDANIVAPCNKGIRTIVDQVTELKQILRKGSQYDVFYRQNCLFAFWIGINDAHITANDRSISDKEIDGIMEKVVNRYIEELNTLYGYGVRNFMLLNVPREHIRASSLSKSNLYKHSIVHHKSRPNQRRANDLQSNHSIIT
jgi:GDSL-like Lipase/Acylhydrolase